MNARITELFKFLTSGLCVIASLAAAAQDYGKQATINYINQRLSGCSIEVNKNGFVTAAFMSKGEVAREDEFFIGDIDSLRFSTEESALILQCAADQGECIKRSIFVRDAVSYYSRVNLTSSCTDKQCVGLRNAFQHLIYLHTEENHLRTVPFEQE